MPDRVKLCAIAKNEGAYLADWVFHHLHFGFDAVEVWINDTDDTSVEIMEAIGSAYEQVTFQVADELLRNSLARNRYFQYRAYARMARQAAEQRFTHVAFLDLDEYWTPRDLTTRIGSFVPEDERVNVVSFPWCLDLPDPGRAPFGPAVGDRVALQLDPHVKSVVRLDDRVQQLRTHTARTRSGHRLLIDEPFPLVDERRQQWGSVVPDRHLTARWDTLPPAFVLHAVHRSQVEYVASLAKGLRQTGADLAFKTNRPGFARSGAPELVLTPGVEALADYRAGRTRFRARVGADDLTQQAERLVVSRADTLLAAAAADETVMAQLRDPLRGISAPALDERYPGWDARTTWHVDVAEIAAGRLRIEGWGYGDAGARLELAVRAAAEAGWQPVPHEPVARPDVQQVHPQAPLESGFRIEVPLTLAGDPEGVALGARVPGRRFWDARPLAVTRAGHHP